MAKRGAHSPPLISRAPDGFDSFESTYGSESLAETEDWLMGGDVGQDTVGVRIITGAPEVEGVMEAISIANKRGICFNIGHRLAPLTPPAICAQRQTYQYLFDGRGDCRDPKWRPLHYSLIQRNASTAPQRPFHYRFVGFLAIYLLWPGIRLRPAPEFSRQVKITLGDDVQESLRIRGI